MVDGEMATVSGTVPNEESLSAAALAVLAVPGVAQLDNRLEIGPAIGSADLEVALLAALAADEFAYVRVEVQNGLATLSGSVPTEEARSQVVATAGEIDGIEKIDNRLIVDTDLRDRPGAAARTARGSGRHGSRRCRHPDRRRHGGGTASDPGRNRTARGSR